MRSDFFYRLPPPTVLVLLSSLLDLTEAHVLQHMPRQTQAPTVTVPFHELSVVSWPPRPTTPPSRDLFALRRRQQNTICGYIGGDSALPATCSAGSHCVLDTDNNVVGCCPNGEATCTAGVYTGCVDETSGPQTEVNPYIFSCGGGQVCYQNVFQGGFSQFGCGSATDQGTIVLASPSGISVTLTLPTVTVSYSFTETSTSSSSTSTSSSSSNSSSSSSSSTTTTSSSVTSSTVSSTSTLAASTSTSAPDSDPESTNRTGAIVGGTIGGLAVLIALAALIAFLVRRRQKKVRDGPGVRDRLITPSKPGPGAGFSAVNQDSEAYEPPRAAASPNPVFTQPMRNLSGQLPPISTTPVPPPMPFEGDVSPVNDDASPFAYGGPQAVSAIASSHTSYPPSEVGSFNYQNYPPMPPISAGGVAAHTPIMHGPPGGDGYRGVEMESDQVPLTREIDEFSHGFTAALGRIGEEDEHDLGDSGHMMPNGRPYGDSGFGTTAGDAELDADGNLSGTESSVYSRGSRPLWQQNRRQSRNLMWM